MNTVKLFAKEKKVGKWLNGVTFRMCKNQHRIKIAMELLAYYFNT